ncbi:MAG TPA: MIP family channel protein [Blastocatellia bacterium]|jgi:MIP family channel proteins|nr:MIP family channel protein [Blastocatellia bacterium]
MQRDTLKRELYAEFLGTFVMIAFGTGVVAQVVLSGEKNGGYLSINLAWGLAVTMAIYVAGGVSGAHLNPAVTLALAVRRDFSRGKIIPYCLAQTAGAFLASAVVFFTYREAFAAFDGGARVVAGDKATAGIFATYPQPFLSIFGGLVDQIVGTALLMLVILAITDARNNAPSANLAPLIIGLLVAVLGMCFGFNAGYAINPARDLGPRLFTFIAGWGGEVFRAGNYWFWVPIVGPLVGGVIGASVYDGLIGNFLPAERVEPGRVVDEVVPSYDSAAG